MQDDEFLIIACKSYDSSCENQYKNIKIKKIPNMLLSKCEFGKEDYNLNIINPPTYDEEEDFDE
jgi:adenine-specific DNA-methyltransferase